MDNTTSRTEEFGKNFAALQKEAQENMDEVRRRADALIDIVGSLYPQDMTTMAALFVMALSGAKLVRAKGEVVQ